MDKERVLLSIVIPTYNEKENIEPLVKSVSAALGTIKGESEILIVDDDSPDGTSQEAFRLAEDYPVDVLVRKNERGLATAVMAGFDRARGDIVCVMDADLSHRPQDIPALFKALEDPDVDLVVGSRFVPGGGTENWSRWRGFVSWAARSMGRGLCPVRDLTSGFFMFRKDILHGVRLAPIGYKILLEMLVKCRLHRVLEVPIIFRDRTFGQSKLDSRTTLAYIRHLIALYLWIIFRASAKDDAGPTITFARFGLVGVSGIIVNYGLFSLFRWGFQIPYLVAAGLAIEISIITNFLLNNFWTWRHRGRLSLGTLLKRVPQYHLVAGIAAFGGNWLVLFILADLAGLPVDPSYFIGIGVGMFINYFLNDRWTFAQTMWESNKGVI